MTSHFLIMLFVLIGSLVLVSSDEASPYLREHNDDVKRRPHQTRHSNEIDARKGEKKGNVRGGEKKGKVRGGVDPVVIVPGIFGSQLEAKWNKTSSPHYYCSKNYENWTTLWLCFECMVPKVIDCWVDNMLLNFTNGDLRDRDGVSTKINDFGGTGGVECIDKNCYYPYFKQMIEGILQIPGYEKGLNLLAAPYDFRYAANSLTGRIYLSSLQSLVEETYTANSNKPVSLIAHSMGNLFLMEFFKSVGSSWKNKYIKRYVSISGVFGGSVKSLRALVSGEIESIPRVLVNANEVRKFQRTFQSIYWLLPKKQLWNKTEIVVFAPEKNYTVYEYADLLTDAGNPLGKGILDSLKGSTELVEPGVDVFCIHGADIETPAQFRWRKGYFPDYQPEDILGLGDGTVNKRSLEVCKSFKRLKDHKVFSGIKHGEHMQILLNPDLIDYVKQIIKGNVTANMTDKDVVF